MILRLFRWGASVLVVTFLAVATWTFTWPLRAIEDAPEVDAILCLGGGVARDDSLRYETQLRAETCAALYLAGKAPLIVMSAGPAQGGGTVPGSETMANVAIAAGVPSAAILRETQSYSTLQNALYSLDLVPDAGSVLVVTEGFHLPRSWASVRWAGFDQVHLFASERIRPSGVSRSRTRMLVRETVAIWFNLARASAYSIGGLMGLSREARIGWLY